ncbi:hypothetical protein [Streptomyces sp. NPDC054854]
MKTHRDGYPEPSTVPVEQQVRTCRPAADAPASSKPPAAGEPESAIVRGDD